MKPQRNIDDRVVEGFGEECTRFDQTRMSEQETENAFSEYFSIFPWKDLPSNAVGFDLGCGSGRWAKLVASRVGTLHCIDASPAALRVAQKTLAAEKNVEFHEASVENIPLPDRSADFGYSLGVLHHVPDTAAGIRSCVAKLKDGAPFLVYLYYRFDNRPRWFVMLWKVSDLLRKIISRLPDRLRFAVSELIAALVYWPLSRFARLVEIAGGRSDALPLSYYRRRSFYTLRTDALDRFGTRLENRFTRSEIKKMMEDAGLADIVFREGAPFWCAVGRRAGSELQRTILR